ncbi:hypothetical protein N431DRAFT_468485 [Stipitochalara longipes BDJ]|nr:hypothetical protein N431DRAFT_468485 [Stipitochalara longipes BDJ]
MHSNRVQVIPSTLCLALVQYGAYGAIYVMIMSNGIGDLIFTPNVIQAAVGGAIEFHFYGPKHSVAQSNLQNLHQPVHASAFFSRPTIIEGAEPNSQTYTLLISSTDFSGSTVLFLHTARVVWSLLSMHPDADGSQTLVMYQSAAAQVAVLTYLTIHTILNLFLIAHSEFPNLILIAHSDFSNLVLVSHSHDVLHGLTPTGSPPSSGLSSGAKIGISSTLPLIFTILLLISIFWFLQRKKNSRDANLPEPLPQEVHDSGFPEPISTIKGLEKPRPAPLLYKYAEVEARTAPNQNTSPYHQEHDVSDSRLPTSYELNAGQ